MNRCVANRDGRELAGGAQRIALAVAIVAGLALWGYAAGPQSRDGGAPLEGSPCSTSR